AGGTLNLTSSSNINNFSGVNTGTISSNGSGSTVDVSATLHGGTLSTSGGGFLGTVGSAELDGSTHAITLSGGTYTAGNGTTTSIVGTMDLDAGSSLALSGNLQLTGGVTLSGPG